MPRIRIFTRLTENTGISTGVSAGMGCLYVLVYFALALLGILGVAALIYSLT